MPVSDYRVSDDPASIDVEMVWRFLHDETYWARGRSREVVARALEQSLVVGAYASDGAQVGFARAVTDRATFAWVADVFVLPGHRGRGLSHRLVDAIVHHPELASVYRFTLATADAHGLYAAHGFTPLPDAGRWMILTRE